MGGAVIIENYSSATAGTAQTKALTPQDIERMAKLLGSMPPEPIGKWMRQQGRPPEQWRVVLPALLRDDAGWPALWPDYVAFSKAIDEPVFVPRVLPWAWGPT